MLVRRTIRNVEQEYEYKGKEKKCDSYIQIRIEQDKKDKLVQKAKELGYSSYSKLIKEMIDKLVG